MVKAANMLQAEAWSKRLVMTRKRNMRCECVESQIMAFEVSNVGVGFKFGAVGGPGRDNT
jgi:hypothetical protein